MNTALTKDQLLADRLDLPVAAIDTEVTLGGSGDSDVGANSRTATDACYHLTIDGDCPDNPGEIAVSRRTATARDLKVGDHLAVRIGPATAGTTRPSRSAASTPRPTVTPRTGAAPPTSAPPRAATASGPTPCSR